MSSYVGVVVFRLTAKPLINVTFPDIASAVEPDAPIYQLVFYNVLIRQWSIREGQPPLEGPQTIGTLQGYGHVPSKKALDWLYDCTEQAG